MIEERIKEIYYKVTCNECREMTLEMFKQAVKEILSANAIDESVRRINITKIIKNAIRKKL